MRVQVLALLASVSGVALAQYNGIAPCAQACVGGSIQAFNCKILDIGCICKNQPLIDALACCVGKSCPDKKDQEGARVFANQICAPYAVTLPAAATCAKGVSTILPTGGALTGGAGAATTTASSSPSSASATSTGSATTTASSAASSAAAASAGAGSSTSGNAAARQTMGVGLGAAVVGAIALL